MPGEASAPFLNMRFRVEIEGMPESGVVEVVFPEARLTEGARSRGRATYGKLFLRRGVTESREWLAWWDEARRAGRGVSRNITVTLLDAAGRDLQRWTFRDTRPVAYSLSSLNALVHEVLMETLEISVDGLESSFDTSRQRHPSKTRKTK
jgi:phage tail-like protein